MLPCEDNLLRNMTLDRPSRYVGRYDSLPFDIEKCLLDIFEQEISLQRRLDILKGDLECRYDFSAYASYRSVDKYNDGRISTLNLGSFLRSCGHYATERELLTIIRRIDTDGDASLSYAEFSEFLRSSNPPARQVLEEADRAHRAASAEKFRRSMGAGSSHSSPLKAQGDGMRAHSAGRGHASFASPEKHASPLRESSPCKVHNDTFHRMSPARKPILNIREEDELVTSLRDFIQLERELESNKVSLALKSDFNMTDAFKIFDQRYLGNVTVHDLRDGLSAIGVFPTSEEVELFLTRYDEDHDRRLTMREFENAFLAQDSYYASMVTRRPSNYRHPLYRRDDCFYSDTAIEFRNMWRVHFKVESQAETIRRRLASSPYFNVYEAFNSLDLNDNNSISADEFKRLIESRGFYVSYKEADQVLKKFDADHNGRVTYSEVSIKLRVPAVMKQIINQLSLS